MSTCELAQGAACEDIVFFGFKRQPCGQSYRFHAKTYHGLHQRGVDDLAVERQTALCLQLLQDLLEHLVANAGLRQAVTEQPASLGARDAAAFGQVQKTQEAAAVQQLILQRVIDQAVQLLQHQELDHQDRRLRRTAASGTRRTWRSHIDSCCQRREIHMLGQDNQHVAKFLAPVFTLLLGEQTDL